MRRPVADDLKPLVLLPMDNSSMVDAAQWRGQREWEYAIELRRSATEDRWIDFYGVAKDEVDISMERGEH